MHPSERVVIARPMGELWDERGPVLAGRTRDLPADDIRQLLRLGPLRFVVADVGLRPRWLREESCFAFWKSEVQPRLAEPDVPARLDDFPGGYCYFASEWSPDVGSPIVVLEMMH